MRPLDLIFWTFCASVVAFIAWSFLRMFAETLRDGLRDPRRQARRHNAGLGNSASGGLSSGNDAATLMSGSDSSTSTDSGDFGSGDSGGGGDFSGGGGESGGGGSSGGW